MKKDLKTLVSLLLALTMVLGLACYAAASEEEQPAEDGEKAQDVFDLSDEELAALPRIGEETEDCATLMLLNLTEGDITSVSIRASGETEWSLNLLPDDEVFGQEEMALLCFEPEEDALYDIQFIFSNFTGSAIHDVDFADVTQAELHRQWNGQTYLVYTSLSTEEEVDTSEAEQARLEADVAASTTATAAPEETTDYTGGWYTGGYTGGGSSDSGSSDSGCLDDGLFW